MPSIPDLRVHSNLCGVNGIRTLYYSEISSSSSNCTEVRLFSSTALDDLEQQLLEKSLASG